MSNIKFFCFLAAVCIFAAPYYATAQLSEADTDKTSLELLLNTPVSAAAKYEQSVSDAPASVTVITSVEINNYGFQTLQDVFQIIQGFYTSDDHNYTYLGVRGFSRPTDYNNRILLLVNGHALNENVYGSAAIGTELGGFNLASIDRIEIIRGPGSALYGTNAMFAIINIVTQKGKTIDGLEITAEYGSHNFLVGSALFGKKYANGLDVTFSARWVDDNGEDIYFAEFDDPSTNNGIAKNMDWDDYYAAFSTVKYGAFSAQLMYSSREKGIPTAAWETLFNSGNTKSIDNHGFAEIKFENKFGNDKQLMARSYIDHYNYEGWYPYEDEILYNSYDATVGNWFGGEAQFLWDISLNNRLTIGSEYQHHRRADYRSWDDDTTYFNQNFPYSIVSLYVQDEFQILHNLSFTAGIRFDKNDQFKSSQMPRGAFVYHPFSTSTAKLVYGEAFRAPNVYETNYDDPLFGFKANPGLKPEKIKTTEIIWEQQFTNQFSGMLSIYRYKMQDLIDQDIDPLDSLIQYRNFSKVQARGIEIQLASRVAKGFNGFINYGYQWTEDVISGESLTNSPAHLVKAGFSYPFFPYVTLSGNMLYETARKTIYGSNTKSYVLMNANLITQLFFDHFRLRLQVRNLLDQEYQLPGGFEHIQSAIVQPRRAFSISLESRL